MFKVFKTSGIEGNYSVSSYPLFVNNNCWAIYPAKHKTTKKSYSVWQFQKKEWENRLTNDGIINKNNKQLIMNDIYDNIRNFISNQSKFKHPNFVTVIEPLEDHKSRILFVTECVINDLYNVNKNELDEIMITRGLLQICNGLKFLHESVKSVDLNLNPSSIMLTENYDWKISGLTFLENITNGIIEKYIDSVDSRLPSFLSIDFRFTSPNLLTNHKVDYINDLFSICCVIYFLFNNGDMLIKCPPNSSVSDYQRHINKLNQLLKSAGKSTKHASFDKIPDNFYLTFLDILQNSQESNTDVIQLKKTITINDIIESKIFNNDLIKVLNSLDEYTTYSNHEKINFLKTLKTQIEKFPKPLLINKFIPILIGSIDMSQFKKSKPTSEMEELIVECSENLIILSNSLSQLTFTEKVFPFILSILKKIPFDGFKILLLKNLTNIQNGLNASINNNSSNDAFQKFSLDLFEKCINDQNSMVVQELNLMYVKTVLTFQQYSTITSNILPKLCTLYSTTTSLKVKNLTVTTFITMISGLENKVLDDFLIVDTILPLIYNTSSTIYSNSKFTHNILDLYSCIYTKLSKSSTKKFNTKGTETELYDIIMELGFNTWKIAKYISNKEDLDIVYNLWDIIVNFMKNDLESHIVLNGNKQSNENNVGVGSKYATTELPTVSNINTSVYTSRPEISPTPPAMQKTNFNNNITNNSSISDGNTYGSIGVMKANKTSILNNKTSNTTTPLSFGQTTPASASSPSTTNNIDWSKAGSYSVMQPTNKKIELKKATDNTSLPGYNNVMQPMAPTKIGKVTKVNSEDEWSDFAVGSTTTKDPWNEGSLI